MSWRAGIHGYAARFEVVTAPTTNGRSVLFEPGCFQIGDARKVPIWFMHRSWQSYGRGDDLNLELWQDDYGLAFSFIPPSSAFSLVSGIADGRYAECSVGFAVAVGNAAYDRVADTPLREISIVSKGACPGTACWHAANAPDGIPAHARAVSDRWATGRARYLASRARLPSSPV